LVSHSNIQDIGIALSVSKQSGMSLTVLKHLKLLCVKQHWYQGFNQTIGFNVSEYGIDLG
jgi:hypothetical protein